jgi:cobalt/nickel transport system permease protein
MSFSENYQPLWQMGNLIISGNSLTVFFLVQLKYCLSLLLLFTIMASVSSKRIIRALEYFRIADWILAVLQYILQLIRILVMEFERIHTAYKSRSVRPGFFLKIKTVSGLVYVLMIRIIERSELIFLAMLSRGFKGKFYLNGDLAWKTLDTLVLVGISILTIWPIIAGDILS